MTPKLHYSVALDPRDYLTRTAAAFGWSLKQLCHRLETHDLALEFLGLHDEEMEA